MFRVGGQKIRVGRGTGTTYIFYFGLMFKQMHRVLLVLLTRRNALRNFDFIFQVNDVCRVHIVNWS